jgi:hypothetical protein
MAAFTNIIPTGILISSTAKGGFRLLFLNHKPDKPKKNKGWHGNRASLYSY